MKKQLLTLIATLGLAATLAATQAAAQNMDMSWGIRSQMQYQQQGDAYARAMAQYYYNYMQGLRRNGYTGPSLDTGFNANTLQQSMRAAQQSMDAFHASSANSSNQRSNAAEDYSYRAIQGCQLVVNANGYRYYVCPR